MFCKKTEKIDNALDRFNESLAIKEQIKDEQGQAATLQAIGSIYAGKMKWELAKASFQRSLNINEKLGIISDKRGYAEALHSMAWLLNQIGEIDRVLEYLQHSLAIKIEIKDILGIVSTVNEMISFYERQKMLEQAKNYFSDLQEKNANDKEIEAEIMKALTNIQQKLSSQVL